MIKSSSLASDQLAKAYRAWDSQVKNSTSENPYIVCVDDLSNLPRHSLVHTSDGFAYALDTFNEAHQNSSKFPKEAFLKITNSLAFISAQNLEPTKFAVENCGGIFELTSENSIRQMTEEIKYLETLPSHQFESFNTENSYPFAQDLIESGYTYLSSKIKDLLPLDFRFDEPRSQNLFGAQVVTDERGAIVCQMPSKQSISPLFYLTIIHEILGHVLHFTQLRGCVELQSQPHLLCLSNHTHESFFIEAIAQLITTYLVKKSSWHWPQKNSLYLADLKYHRNQTIAHLLMTNIIEGKINSQDAARTHHDLCEQVGSSQALAMKYQSVVSNLFSIKLALNYAPSFDAIKPLLAQDEENFFPILSKMIHKYFTPESLKTFVKESTKGDLRCI